MSACHRQQSREWLIANQGAREREVLPRQAPEWLREKLCMSVRALRDLGAHHAAPLLQDRGAGATHLSLQSAISLGAGVVFNGVHTNAPLEQISLASHPNMP